MFLRLLFAAVVATAAVAHDYPARGGGGRAAATPAPAPDAFARSFCDDPETAICGGDAERDARAEALRRFERSAEGSFVRSDPNRPLRRYYDRIAETSYAPRRAIAAIVTDMRAAVARPAVRAHLERTGADRLAALSSVTILAEGDDFDRVPAADRPDVERAFAQVCLGPWPDNAINIRRRYVLICPQRLLRIAHEGASDPELGLIKVLGHELGHNLDWGTGEAGYAEMARCLARHHNEPDAHGARLVAHEMRGFMHEITADYWGAVAVGAAIARKGARSAEAVLRAELTIYCDASGTSLRLPRRAGPGGVQTDDDDETHPRGTWRIRFIGLQPAIREAIGCPAPPRVPGCAIGGAAPPARW